MKTYKGKAIYQPSGKAAEYSKWACNFYVGCSNGCEYCYLRKGRGAKILGGSKPQLKKYFIHENDALDIFYNEMMVNKSELQIHGLFFSFTTDPFLPETEELTATAAGIAVQNDIPVKILTKCTDWIESYFDCIKNAGGLVNQHLYAFGFTLTGHDELEPNASTNAERIEAMQKLHDAGFKTFASIEPVINFADSLSMIEQAAPYCDLFKIGLKAGDKYHFELVREFIKKAIYVIPTTPIYFKDSLLKQAGINRDELPSNCVNKL